MLTLGDDFESSEVENIGSGLAVKAVNWCGHCNLPFYEQLCPCCGSKKAFSVSDIRPVFPEEQLLLGCIDSLINENEDPLRYTKHTVWCAGNYYIIDGKKSKYDLKRLSTLSYEKIKQIKPKFPGIICNYINSILHYRRKTSVVNYELATYPPAYQNSSGT